MGLPDVAELYRSAPDPAPLQGLRDVDWSALKDAYGPAKDVPALLRTLMADDPAHREYACLDLFQTIWHQGSVYSASAAAIPFLYNLMEAEGPQDKAAIADLIATIADGAPPFLHCAEDPEAAAFWGDMLKHSGQSLELKIAEGRVVAAEVRRQVAMRSELLQPYLSSDPK